MGQARYSALISAIIFYFSERLVTIIVQQSPNMNINEISFFNDFFLFQQEERQIKNLEST
jgi:hypothetical protein